MLLIKGLSVKPGLGHLGHGQTVQTWANSADPDQMPQYAASDQGLHCLLKLLEGLNETVKSSGSGPFSQPTLRDNQPTSAVSALISLPYQNQPSNHSSR